MKIKNNALIISSAIFFLLLAPAFNPAKAAATCVSCSCTCGDGTEQAPIDFGAPVQNNDTGARCVELCTNLCGNSGFGNAGGQTCCPVDPDTNQCAGQEAIEQGECECCLGSAPSGDYRTAEDCANNCAAMGGFRSFNGDASGSSCANQEGAQPPTIQQLPNPLGEGADIPEIIARVIKAAVGLVGSIGLLMFIYGGFTWMTAGGNEKRVEQGKQVLTWAVLGLVLIFSSYAILSFVIDRLTNPAPQAQEERGG